ncbi:helix-turn-helix domain-containing protein [Feifania hominis]|uniref:helix-turn-helix domain-containing protein n=1 Tax=Feifania hominis TaxID=2763660 RepID=UPI002016224E|nr:helix-turn-helix transcriptional regulator [Feifania hominis]
MRDIGSIVGENIRYYRQRRGLSQEKLALEAEISTSYLGDIERGGQNPTINTLYLIAKALGIDAYLLIIEKSSVCVKDRSTRELYRRIYRDLLLMPEECRETLAQFADEFAALCARYGE